MSNGTDTMYFQYDTKGVPLGYILNGVQYFYITNQMGDVVAITDSNGDVIGEYVYDEWGYILSENTMDPDTDLEPVKAVEMNPIRYRGYYYDAETGYYYLQSRYYDPSICRFINADIPEIAQVSKDVSTNTNLFTYCNNEPVNNVDYDGYYNASLATNYARKWWNSFNPIYKTANKNRDCANFVSQCLYAGKFSKMTLKWYNRKLLVSDAWGSANKLANWLKTLTSTSVISTKKEVNFLAMILLAFKRSDCSIVIIFDHQGDGVYDHAVINGYIDPVEYDIYFYGHSTARNGKKYLHTRSKSKNPSLCSYLDANKSAKIFIPLLY